MTHRNGSLLALAGAVTALLACGSLTSSAADAKPAATRTVLLQADLDVPGREVLMVAVEVPPDTAEGLHTHSGELFSLVQQGELTFEMEGVPTRVYHPGEVLHVPAGKVHQGINHGKVPVKIAAFFVAQKGKPLTVPVP